MYQFKATNGISTLSGARLLSVLVVIIHLWLGADLYLNV